MTTATEPIDLYEEAVQAAIETFRARGVTVQDDTVRAAVGAARYAYIHRANMTERLDLDETDEEWLSEPVPGRNCGLKRGCLCTVNDPRPLLLKFKREVDRLQGEVARRDLWRRQVQGEHALNARGWREQIGDLQVRLDTVLDGSTLGRVQALYAAATELGVEPPDGTYISRDMGDDDETVFYRADREADQERGDWWPANEEHPDRWSWGEILGWDDPVEDRRHHNIEVLIPASELGRALADVMAAVKDWVES